jgi:hypothetical protein
MSPEEVDRQALLSALTTEHFTLQGARGSTVSESTARAALFVGALSTTLVALGFIAQASDLGSAFDVFVLVALPTLYALGWFTFVRLVESSVEDIAYGRAINRIRAYYLQLAGEESRYFMLPAHDDARGVLANMGMAKPSRFQLQFTLAGMIAVLTAVVGGGAVAFLVGVLGAPLGVAVPIGGVVAMVSLVFHTRFQQAVHERAGAGYEALFPTP